MATGVRFAQLSPKIFQVATATIQLDLWIQGNDNRIFSFNKMEKRQVMKIFLTSLFMLFFTLSNTMVSAKSRSIVGQWKGGGSFTTPSGSKERTRCRATVRVQSTKRYSVYARCAVASLGIIEQTGMVRRIAKNRYRGRFTNSQYDIHGSIYITLRGNKQYITLRSRGGGKGNLTFRRQR